MSYLLNHPTERLSNPPLLMEKHVKSFMAKTRRKIVRFVSILLMQIKSHSKWAKAVLLYVMANCRAYSVGITRNAMETSLESLQDPVITIPGSGAMRGLNVN